MCGCNWKVDVDIRSRLLSCEITLELPFELTTRGRWIIEGLGRVCSQETRRRAGCCVKVFSSPLHPLQASPEMQLSAGLLRYIKQAKRSWLCEALKSWGWQYPL